MDAAAEDPISKEKEKLAQGIVGRNFYQDIKQDLDKPSEDDRVPIMSGPVISSFQDAVQKDLDANMNQSDAKQRLLNIMNERIKEELSIEEEANKIIV